MNYIIDRLKLFPLDLGHLYDTKGVYYCSEAGDIYSRKGVDEFYKLTANPNQSGYLRVKLYYWQGNEKMTSVFYNHRLVLESWVRYKNPGIFHYLDFSLYTVDHIDGDKNNNSVTNLRFMTSFDNIRQRKAIYLNWEEDVKDKICQLYFVDKGLANDIAKKMKRGTAGVSSLLRSEYAEQWCENKGVEYYIRPPKGGRGRITRDMNHYRTDCTVSLEQKNKAYELYFKDKLPVYKIAREIRIRSTTVSEWLTKDDARRWCEENNILYFLR